jgi:hypothetical protein
MPTPFVCTIGRKNRDYTHLSTWENAIKCNLTASTTKVYSCTKSTGNTYPLRDSSIVYLYSGNVKLDCTAKLHHATESQALLSNITGSVTPQIGHSFRESLKHDYITLTDNGDSVIAVAECYNDTLEDLWDNVTFKGWKTSSDNYIKIYTPTEERHTGVEGTGFSIYNPGINDIITLYDVDVVIEGIEFKGGAKQIACIYTSPKTITINSCILHDNYYGPLIAPPKIAGAVIKIYNCIMYDSRQSAISSCSPSTLYVENCTIYNPGFGYGVVDGQCYNVVVFRSNNSIACFGSNTTGDYNCDGTSSGLDGTAPGGHSLHNTPLRDINWYNVVDYRTTMNFFTCEGSVLINRGITRKEGDISFNTDILGVTREGYYWDIGAFQAGGSSAYSSSSSSFSSESSSSSSFSSFSSSCSSSSSSSESVAEYLLLRAQADLLRLRDWQQRGRIR